jgi:hypothetical protein
MASDYALIRADNQREYGAGVGRWGQDLLTNRYDDRTHFIFELLQNAGALARRKGWHGSRAVSFTLCATELRIVHCGQPFDVSNVCGIGRPIEDYSLSSEKRSDLRALTGHGETSGQNDRITIRFKPSVIDQLAKEAGIEPGVLDLLRKLGVTSVADLHRLGIKEQQGTPDLSAPNNVDAALKMLLGTAPAPTPPVADPAGAEPSWSGTGRAENDNGTDTGSGGGKDSGDHRDGHPGGRTEDAETGSARRTLGGASARPFISYVATQPDEEGRDTICLSPVAKQRRRSGAK